MFLVEKELRDQFAALDKTFLHIDGRKNELHSFMENVQRICVLGCGSSYCIAKSSALQFSQLTGIASWAVAAGDLLVNFDDYKNLLKGAALLLLSRSGSTSELILAAKKCREFDPDIKIISICAVDGAPVTEIADLNIEIPWAFDQAVCQTRTVSNLYISALMLAAIKGDHTSLLDSLRNLKQQSSLFTESPETTYDRLAELNWSHAVILADSGVAGLADEGALVFKEICLTRSNFYNVLDVRHGPIVTIGKDTLVVVFVSQGNERLQIELVQTVAEQAGHMLVFSGNRAVPSIPNVTTIALPGGLDDNVRAVFMLYCIQLLCVKRALFLGQNPDAPAGLDAWIKLET